VFAGLCLEHPTTIAFPLAPDTFSALKHTLPHPHDGLVVAGEYGAFLLNYRGY
jgi:hypothetical protein